MRRSLRSATRNFRLMWAGQIGRGLAWWLQAVVLAPWILRIGGGPIDLGIVTALQFGAVLVLASLDGVLSDSLPRARVLPALQLVLATISVAFFAMAADTATGALPWIFVLSLLFGGGLLAIMGVRALIGAIPNTTAHEHAARRTMTQGVIGLGLCLILLAAADSAAMAVVVPASSGFLNVVLIGSINQTIQTAVQDDLRGRIIGQHAAVFHGGPAVGGVLAWYRDQRVRHRTHHGHRRRSRSPRRSACCFAFAGSRRSGLPVRIRRPSRGRR